MNEFESHWINWIQSFVQNGWIQDGCHHQIESEWLSEIILSKMAELKMAEFKKAAIIKLSEND